MVLWFDSELLNHIERQENAEAQLMLKEADDPFDLVDSSRNTLLHYAARYGNLDMTKYLIESGSSIDAQNKDGKTPLILAMEHCGSIDVPMVLLDANADINIYDKSDNNPLQLAIRDSVDHRLRKRFLMRLEVEYSFDYEKITDMLISRGYDLGNAMYFGCVEVTEIMLKRGYVPTETDADGKIALHMAVSSMHLENVKLLIKHGADVNAKCLKGLTPMAYILVNHDDQNEILAILKTLMENGAKMFTSNETKGWIMQVDKILTSCRKDIIRSLMKYDVDFNAEDAQGRTVLHALAKNPNPRVFDELKGKNINFNVQTKCDITPLWLAVHNRSSVKFLLDHGADANAGSNEILPLMKPFLMGNKHVLLESVELLLAYGADVYTKLDDEFTIFDAAIRKDRLMLIEPVLAHVAMLRASGKPIPTLAAERIRGHEFLRERLDFYGQEVEKMKAVTVCRPITLYNLLTDSDDKIFAYMRNEKLVLKLSRLNNKCGFTSYYHTYLRRRLTKALQVVKLKEEAATVLCKMTGLVRGVITDKIIYYLDSEDLQELYYLYK